MFGAAPKAVEAPENSLAFEVTWACTSSPITISQSPVAPAIVLGSGSVYSSSAIAHPSRCKSGRRSSAALGPAASAAPRQGADGPPFRTVSCRTRTRRGQRPDRGRPRSGRPGGGRPLPGLGARAGRSRARCSCRRGSKAPRRAWDNHGRSLLWTAIGPEAEPRTPVKRPSPIASTCQHSCGNCICSTLGGCFLCRQSRHDTEQSCDPLSKPSCSAGLGAAAISFHGRPAIRVSRGCLQKLFPLGGGVFAAICGNPRIAHFRP